MHYRLWLAPEGQAGTDGRGFDAGSLSWRSTVPVRHDGEIVGLAGGIERVDRDGTSWLRASNVVFHGDAADLVGSHARLDVSDGAERFESVSGGSRLWTEEAAIEAIDLSTDELFAGAVLESVAPDADLVAEADAFLSEFEDGEPMGARWSGVLAVEGEPTGDGRMIAKGAVSWDDSQAPWPLKFDREEGDHTAAIVGSITRIWRDGDDLMGEGTLHTDTSDPETLALVNRTLELLADGTPGVSIELDSEVVELRVRKETWDEWTRETQDILDDEVPPPDDPTVVDGRVTAETFRFDDWLEVSTEARFRGAAIVDRPAFADARIGLVASGFIILNAETETANPDESIQAHAVGEYELPPRDWFFEPEPDIDDPRVVWVDAEGRPTEAGTEGAKAWGVPLTVTKEGRVFGHLANWEDCHTGYSDRCVTPPMSNSGYTWFHTGATQTADGDVPTGRITVDTTHPDRYASASAAVAHYDHTGAAVADVRATDGKLGPWMSGWVRPWATDRQRHELTANPPSGDWRPRGGHAELVGVLSINVPGFPLPRTVASFRHDKLVSLVASGLPPVDESAGNDSDLSARLDRLEAQLAASALLDSL